MLEFNKIEHSTMPLLRKYFNRYPSRNNGFSVGSITMWRNYFNYGYAEYNNNLILSSTINNETCYTYPIGESPDECFEELVKYCEENSKRLIMCSLEKEKAKELAKRFNAKRIEADRDWFDYIYEKEKLITLSGRALSKPRNQLNKFNADNLEYSFEKIDLSNVNEVIEFNGSFQYGAEKLGDGANAELEMCLDVLENFEKYDMPGYLLRVGSKIVGYTVGEVIEDTVFIHIEKADISYRGVYQKLSNEFLKSIDSEEIKYVNREEDCGDPGLRKAKLAYQPHYLLEKYTVFCT